MGDYIIDIVPGTEKLEQSVQGPNRLGQFGGTHDGRLFRWSQNGSVALSTGRLLQQAVVVSGHGLNLAVAAAAAVGAASVLLTNSTTAITVDQYAGGHLTINDAGNDVGDGLIYLIKSHPAESTGSGSVRITLADDDPVVVALTTNGQAGLRKHPCDEVIVNPTTPTGVITGVSPMPVTADFYFWQQVRGSCAVLINGTPLVGQLVTAGVSTAGSVDVHPLNSVDGSGQQQVVGRVETVMGSGEFGGVYLSIE